ncbi:MAG: phosphatase PAP2 family protein [Bacteroidetes bacterium]|nr:phosphatase PAP2 family protein [Bacteroidota bacterium]MBP7399504.1 phosphatase PAP2 family protein [Chitinophagales bacterium]MBK7110725.1 phosphatase PAP2 family protein [Bacteroidota bacterium]MBK8488057.1 phosphatase PAP2 family protein [Bacteroidota bacterium]MBK8682186.1 phosphatase PAP2 family protein [Bacteroidota bacterium]
MKKIITDNKWFLIPWLLWSLILLIYVLLTPRGTSTLWVNDQHTVVLDFIFRWTTWLGDGVTVGIICFILLFVQFRAAVFASIVSIANLVITGALKKAFSYPRPATYFETIDLNFVHGIKTYYHLSFPSGHTSAAFCIYLTLAIICKKKKLGLLFFFIAMAVAESRVYLLQHFEEDLLFGSAIAIVLTTVTASLIYKKPLREDSIWNRSLLTLNKKVIEK